MSFIVNAIMFCDYEGHGFTTDYAVSVESAEFYRVYYTFTTSLESLKSEVLTFQCASTVKVNLLKDTAMFANIALADILEDFWRFFTSLRSE